MKKRISQEERVSSEELFSTTFLTFDLIRKYCNENNGFDAGIALNVFLFYAKCASIQETKQVFATDEFVGNGLGYSRETILKYRNALQEVGCLEKITKRDQGKIVGHYVKVKFFVNPTIVNLQPQWCKNNTNTDINKYINTDINKILSKDNTTNVVDVCDEENDEQEGIALTKEQIDEVISNMKNKKDSPITTKVFGNKDIAEICQKFRDLCEEYGLAYNSTNDRKAAKRLTGKPFFTDKIAISGCEDLLCYIESIFAGNQKLGEYAYAIGGPQPFFYNAEKVYNKLKMGGKWNTENSPAKIWFNEFISTYPKREGTELALQRYITNVKTQEQHNEILEGTIGMVKALTKLGRDLAYVKASNTFLSEARRKDYLVSTMISDDSAYSLALEANDVELFREHLKSKYGSDRSINHGSRFTELKNALIENSRKI